ncbi:MAG: LytR/AlgR family response regulator transcription factor [Acidimicrobiales bacterium]
MKLLNVLAVDDELPALDEVAFLLNTSGLAGRVVAASDATNALRELRDRSFDLVIADIAMPGLGGLELASVISRFVDPPSVVFVTAHAEYALEAFDVGAVGYLLKPLDADRLNPVLRRVMAVRATQGAPGGEQNAKGDEDRGDQDRMDIVVVEQAGKTLLVERSQVAWVESAGDYVRLHTFDGRSLLVRVAMSRLEAAWTNEGFTRIHRQHLVNLRAVRELRGDGGKVYVVLPDVTLGVARRHVRDLHDHLVSLARRQH